MSTMKIPDFQTIMLPLLQILKDGKEHISKSIIEDLALDFKLSDEERRELLPSGTQTVFSNRVGWARAYMKNAGLISSPKRAVNVITERGLEVLIRNPEKININFLNQYQEFRDYHQTKKPSKFTQEVENTFNEEVNTPEEIKIVLIDGEQLCNLMIEYNIGVATNQVFEIKKLDNDYFEGE